jgi:hypothetical protein
MWMQQSSWSSPAESEVFIPGNDVDALGIGVVETSDAREDRSQDPVVASDSGMSSI